MISAVEKAQLGQFVAQLPEGIHTPLGEWGTRLSGGQAQRVALARAFLKDAPLVLMDEPTAHLDHELETSLETVTRDLMQNRTVITIAHRLSTIQNVDQVIVLDAGKIIQVGRPDELLREKSVFQALIRPAGGEA